ncbi:hypothetical protein [Clostridioides difficile]
MHLKLLSSLSRKLINKEFKDSLLKSDNVEEISNLIKFIIQIKKLLIS